MKTKLLILALLLGGTLQAQRVSHYFAKNWKTLDSPVDAVWIRYYKEVEQDSLNPSKYYAFIVDREGKLYSEYWYESAKEKNWVEVKFYYKDGSAVRTRTVYKKKKKFEFFVYYKNGDLRRKETYKKNGKIEQAHCYDENGKLVEFFPYYTEARYPGGDRAFSNYLVRSLDLGDKGYLLLDDASVEFGFRILEDGSITEFELLKSSGISLVDVAVMNVVLSSPDWIPAKKDGEAVQYRRKFGWKLK
ncbi:MAG: energy transducer TonB [Flavobacteriaceae bacterium]